MHEHFDAEGNPAGHTIVTRTSLWDDASRARAMRLDEYDRSIDSETGLSRDEAYQDQPFVVHNDIVNYAAKAIARERAKDTEAHKDDEGWMDGRRYIAQPATAEQIAAFLAKQQPD